MPLEVLDAGQLGGTEAARQEVGSSVLRRGVHRLQVGAEAGRLRKTFAAKSTDMASHLGVGEGVAAEVGGATKLFGANLTRDGFEAEVNFDVFPEVTSFEEAPGTKLALVWTQAVVIALEVIFKFAGSEN